MAPVTNSTDAMQGANRLGCDTYVSENKHKCVFACESLFEIQQEIIQNKALPEARWLGGGVEKTGVICMSLRGDVSSPTVLGSFSIGERYANHTEDPLPVVHYIEAKQRAWSEQLKQYLDTHWYRLGMRAERFFTLKDMIPGFQYKFRVMAVHPEGTVGSFAESDWLKTLTGDVKLSPPISLRLKRQFMMGLELNAEITWLPDPSYPSCFYHIAWYNEERLRSRSFPIDEGMGYLLPNLSYSSNYTVKIRAISGLKQSRLESFPVSTLFHTRSCLDSHNHSFTVCGPGEVRNVSITIQNETAYVFWQNPKYTTPWNGVSSFTLHFRSLPHLGYCLEHMEDTVMLPSNVTEFNIFPLSDGCHYQVKISGNSTNDRAGAEIIRQFNFSRPKLLQQNKGVQGSQVPFHPAYFLVVVGCFLVLVSVVVGVYIKLKKSTVDVRKHPLTLQLSNLLSKALYRNTLYADASREANGDNGSVQTDVGGANSAVFASETSSGFSASTISGSRVILHRNAASVLPELITNQEYFPEEAGNRLGPNELTMMRYVQCEKVLGEGTFGKVYRATCWAPGFPTVLAIKILKDGGDSNCHLKAEFELMENLHPHPHIVRYLGKCWMLRNGRDPDALMMEYCSEGNLKEYLIKQRVAVFGKTRKDSGVESPTEPVQFCLDFSEWPRRFLSYARQITLGMEYLSSEKLVHRDLAARNVLVCEGGEIVKISDFGLTRPEGRVSSGGQMPVKWMAPESLKERVFTEQSDVWSFGVLLWEIVTVGGDPYPGVPLADLFSLIRSGYRMPKPEMCGEHLYSLMMDCWVDLPPARPSFSVLRRRLEKFLEDRGHYLNLEKINLDAVYYKNLTDIIVKDSPNSH